MVMPSTIPITLAVSAPKPAIPQNRLNRGVIKGRPHIVVLPKQDRPIRAGTGINSIGGLYKTGVGRGLKEGCHLRHSDQTLWSMQVQVC